MTAAMSSVLTGTEQRLRALRPERPDVYSVRVGVPSGSDWHLLDTVAADGTIAAWCGQVRERANPGRLASVAAATVGKSLTHAVLGRVTAALLLEHRAWDVTASNLAVHRDAEGHLDRVAVREPAVTVLPGDPVAGAPGTSVVPDLPALLDGVAHRAVRTLAPLFDAVRAATRYGIVPLWNGAADAVLGTAAFVPIYAGTDQRAGGDLGVALVDALVAHGAPVRTRGGHEPLRWGEQSYRVPVRGTCCLYYKTQPPVEQSGDEYCTTCPFLDAGERRRRFRSFLDASELPVQGSGPVR